MRTFFAAVAMLMLLAASHAQDSDKVAKAKQIRAKIEDLRKQIADLEKELAAAEGGQYIGPVKDGGRFSLKVGDKGNFGTHRYRVEEVIGLIAGTGKGNAYICRVEKGAFRFLVSAQSSGISDGSFVKLEGNWEITGPGTVRGSSLFFVRPLDGAKIIPD